MAYSKVERQLWDDERFRAWPRETRDTWIYLLTCKHQNRIGCYALDPLYIAADVQIEAASARDSLQLLNDARRIVWDSAMRLVMIKRHLKHNEMENPNVVTYARSEFMALPFSPVCFNALLQATERYGPATTAKGAPFYSILADAIRSRLGTAVQVQQTERVENRSENRSANGSGNGLANPSPEPEPSPEPKQKTEAIDKSIGASPGNLLSQSEPAGDPQPIDAHAIWAPLIREHLWRGSKPPKVAEQVGPWSMGRDLTVCDELQAKFRLTVEELAGVIRVARRELRLDKNDELTMRLFYVKGRGDRVQTCLGAWRKQQQRDARGSHGLQRTEVTIGPAR